MPAFAAGEPRKGSDADEEFMLGIRKVGVMVGQAFASTGKEAGGAIGEDALQLANQIAKHFGLRAACIFSGSFGYGTGHSLDTTTCLPNSRTSSCSGQKIAVFCPVRMRAPAGSWR